MLRESRQAVLPLRMLSARWWPVAEELEGSKILRVGFAALGGAVGRDIFVGWWSGLGWVLGLGLRCGHCCLVGSWVLG